MKVWKSILVWFVAVAGVLAADVTVTATASRRQIYLGETFHVTVAVNGADRDATVPSFAPQAQKAATIQLLGSHSNSRSSMTIMNGCVSREVFHGRVFTFGVTPKAEGAFTTGTISVGAKGKMWTTAPVAVNVVGVEKQDRVVVSVRSSLPSALVEEPFTITLSVAIQELPPPYDEANEPLDPGDLPHIQADFLEMRDPETGLKGPDLNQILNELIDQTGRQPSFALNNYVRRASGFDSFFGSDFGRPQPHRFRLSPKRITLNGKKYREYTLSLRYTPTKEGEWTFGPAIFKGAVIADVQQRRAVKRTIYTIGPAVTVRVVPPPDEGRPETFIGTVGRGLKASAVLDATVCKVGDPLTLTLEVTGAISVSNLRAPQLTQIGGGVTNDFRIYDESVKSDTLPNGKRFSYRVRPLRAGTLEFPAIPLSYYDTSNRVYATVKTLPIPIQAEATTQIATEETPEEEGEEADFGVDPLTVVSGVTLDSDGVKNQRLIPTRFWLMLLGVVPPMLVLVAVLLPKLWCLMVMVGQRRKTTGAIGQLKRKLGSARTPQEVTMAMRDYLTQRFDVQGKTLTAEDAMRILREAEAPAEKVERIGASLRLMDEMMYRPDATDARFRQEVEELLRAVVEMDRETKKRGTKKMRHTMRVILVGLIFPLTGWGAETARTFLWEQAHAQMATAQTPGAYKEAAATYDRLIQDGVRNGALFLNAGTAHLLANEPVQAQVAFERAERYVGMTPESRQGIRAALKMQETVGRTEPSWTRTAFFWHYLLPMPVRVTCALSGWAIFWLGLFCRVLSGRKRTKGILRSLSEAGMVAGCFILISFGASALTTWTQERHDDATISVATEKNLEDQKEEPVTPYDGK